MKPAPHDRCARCGASFTDHLQAGTTHEEWEEGDDAICPSPLALSGGQNALPFVPEQQY